LSGSRVLSLARINREEPLIKDVMVRLDGTAADDVRLAAVNGIADQFESHVIALVLNVLPMPVPVESDPLSPVHLADLQQQAREAGDSLEKVLAERLQHLQKPVEIRRFDVFSDAVADIASREARAADTFVGVRPNGRLQESEHLIERVLFESGRHLFLVPERITDKVEFNRIIVAWNGSRESARALAEALPYLHRAQVVSVVVVLDEDEIEENAVLGRDAVAHLRHHGIQAALHGIKRRDGDVGGTLIAEARRRKADLIVMGGYGHSRLREWLQGGATYKLLHEAPVPLLLAH
jgi:nucleotide-binding universal stress UspA family protein